MSPLIFAGLIIVAALVLVTAVKSFIKSASTIAHHLNISTYTISFLIVSIATSLPELVVGINSAISKNPILSFGDVIGSNIALLTLVIAIPILLGNAISTKTIIHNKDVYLTTMFSLLPLALSIDGVLTRTDGGILLAAYFIYFFAVVKRGSIIEQIIERFEHPNMWKQWVVFIFSLLLLLASSEVIVKSALNISAAIGWELGFIGLSITALGTSLPEIAFTISAAKKIHKDSVLGDVIGSVVANSTAVLGTVAAIHPITLVNSRLGYSSLIVLLFVLLTFLRFVKTKGNLDKKEASVLLTIYIAFMFFEFNMQ